MLDNSVTLFNVSLPDISINESDKRLVLCTCKAIVHDSLYSEFDEMSYACVNLNNYGFGYIDYEFSFIENLNNPYMKFYISCFSFRMNTLGYTIKENCPRPVKRLKFLSPKNFTKVNMNGNLTFGIRYFFKSMEERVAFLTNKEICIEGFVALGKKNHTYGIMCRLSRDNDEWKIIDTNTYRSNHKAYIYSLYH